MSRHSIPLFPVALALLGGLFTPSSASPVSTYDIHNPNRGISVSLGAYAPDSKGESDTHGLFQVVYENRDILGTLDELRAELNSERIELRLVNRYNPLFMYTFLEFSADLGEQEQVEYVYGKKRQQEAYGRTQYGIEAGAGIPIGKHANIEVGLGYQRKSYKDAATFPAADPAADADAIVSTAFDRPVNHQVYTASVRAIVGDLAEDMHYHPKTSNRIEAEAVIGQRKNYSTWGPAEAHYTLSGNLKQFIKYTFSWRGYHNYRYSTVGYKVMAGHGQGLDRDTKFRIGGTVLYDENRPYIPGWYQNEIAADSYYLGGLSYAQKVARFENSYIVAFVEGTVLHFRNDHAESGTFFADSTVTGFSLGVSSPFLLASRLMVRLDYSPSADHSEENGAATGILARVDKKF
ncbi:BamA/TamA family outer membrane protein [Chrysiogenes arsenatis]|uniref:BamA/TamA family outer membrane protein n=1 Tax=Chrysiogenes arsenatis TaxID=309797 RepID=UPI00135F199B|nr:BamA/TamA family outer membrane protein [Chrysiogenes arsenatis]